LHRERLSQRFEAALASGVCWLAAPAGYGKTTATVDYLSATGTPHVWYRVDEGDQDVARFFHYLALSLGNAASAMPVFGAEYAEQPAVFARRFFRAYFAQLAPDTVLVLDDVHDADTLEFRRILAVLFRELPDGIRCICLSRTLPQQELSDLAVRGQVSVIDRAVLEFSDDEAQQMVRLRREQNGEPFDVEAAHGWAVGLVLMAEQGPRAIEQPLPGQDGLFDVLGRQFFQNLPDADQQTLLKLSLLPDLSVSLADALVGSRDAGRLLDVVADTAGEFGMQRTSPRRLARARPGWLRHLTRPEPTHGA
jgi:ATP/maltotriose-dependent transcriptional regulator MalT